MIQISKKDDVYTSDHGWLHSRFLFSFAEYFDPDNQSFGQIRVFNDDTIQGFSGFPPHSHREMEIVTIMHEGVLTHEDSMGNKREIKKGYVQRMSAGTGVMHSEMNMGSETVSLYQIWFLPEKKGVTPSYEEKYFKEVKGRKLLVSKEGEEGSLSINASVRIEGITLEKGEEITLSVKKDEHALLYIKSGKLLFAGEVLIEKDQLRISEETLHMSSDAHTEFLLILSYTN
jgi:redox-sensitive bicupin YhaK (pirin superfamily)